ncbi:MMPL family transporter [Actinomadura sp. HBU206391]|uniref:MMPL family transporter n=1 Tax=Actinomadura sp. HBU206391 TaxID=2731692 RepID=UPI00164FCB41|nr:MMPL family transporter [Actinomadura sp. HBU206391]MBC6458288.1 MMPL family transporter [Actinomadura sp. HBU206391]
MRHRWTVLGAWILTVLVIYGASLALGVKGQSDADMLSGQAAHAERLLDNTDWGEEGMTENVLVQARSGTLNKAGSTALVADLTRRYRALTEVTDVREPVLSRDGRSTLLPVELDLGRGDGRRLPKDVVGPILEVTEAAGRAYPDVRIDQVGAGSLGKEISEKSARDFHRAEFISLPITFVVLIVVFGALVAAAVPLILGLSSVLFALGLSAVTSFVVPANVYQPSLVLLLGLAVGVDYSLFYMRRVREERAAGRDPHTALRIASATSGRAVAVSGGAVMVAMTGMFFAGNAIFSSLALGAITVVGVAVIGSLTALPAVLALLGDRIDRLRVPLLGRRRTPEGSRLWDRVLRPVLRAPAIAVSAGLILTGLLAWPVADMNFKMPGDADLPGDYQVVQVLHRVAEAFPGNKANHIVVVQAPREQAGAVATALGGLYERAGSTGDFALTGKPVIVASDDRTVTKMSLAIPHDPATPAARATLDELRTDLAPGTIGAVTGARWWVGGNVAFDADFSKVQRDRLPLVVGFVVLFCLIVMVAAFRSLWIALMTGVLNVASTGAAYGVMVLVFQHQWAEGLLGFESNGAIVSWVPLILFVVLFGLSMDYHVFVLSRVRDYVAAGSDPREAIRQGVMRSAGVVTSAAAIMLAVFAIFATLSTVEMKQLGVGLAVAILLDATLVRGVLLPGMLALLGSAAWPASVRAGGEHLSPVAEAPSRAATDSKPSTEPATEH